MSQVMVSPTSEGSSPAFVSPARVLARSFRISRDKWKQKYQELKKTAKRRQVQAYDACQQRDKWRKRAEAAEQELAALRTPATSIRTAESEKKSPGSQTP